ncbi:MAG: serine hydrolase [Fimbriimonadaceae bacterium]
MFALSLCATLAAGPRVSPSMTRLRTDLDSICRSFNGKMGYYVKNLRTGQTVGFQQDVQFPSASTIKTAIMLEVVKQIEAGKLSWTDTLPLPPIKQRYDSIWLSYMQDNLSINIDGLVNLMITVSDNTAAVLLADKVGVENIENRMNGLGLTNTACLIHVPASNARLTNLRAKFQNMGATSPADMGRLLELIYRKKVASQAGCERMLRVLSHQYWDDQFASQIPPGVYVCSKSGALERSRSDTAIVFGPTPYIVTAYTDDDKDTTWTATTEAHVALRRISHEVWNALNPHMPYDAPADAAKWYPTGAGVTQP